MSTLHLWVEAFEFDSGIMSRKLPVNAFLGRIAPLFPLCGFIYERFQIWDPPIQALQGKGTELDLGDIEPTAMLGGIVDLQTRGEPSGLLWRECLIERANPMRIEVITDQTDTFSLWITGVQQLLHLSGPVNSRLMLSDTDSTQTTQRLCEHEDIGGAVPLVLVVVSLGFPLFRWQRLPDFLNQLHGLFIHAHQRDLRIVRPMINLQDILHMRHKRTTLLGRNDPHLPQMRFQRIFFSICRTVLWLIASTISKATAWSAKSLSVQRAWPAGGALHLSAISRASPSPSKRGEWAGCACFFRLSAASSPCSTNRCLTPSTVLTLTEKLSAILSSVQAGPSASAFNRILACRILYAVAFPFLVSSANCRRSSSVRRTIYFLFMAHSV